VFKKEKKMKKKYMKPMVEVVVVPDCQILTVTSFPVKSLSDSPENINWESEGLDDDDVLR
jgi:hypothetical protein